MPVRHRLRRPGPSAADQAWRDPRVRRRVARDRQVADRTTLHVDARVRQHCRTRVVALAAALLWSAVPHHADTADLPLPQHGARFLAAIASACPTCAASGFTPCGTPDVGWGRRFAPHAFLGSPKRAYLATFTLSGDAFRRLARTTPYPALLTTLRERFAATRLVVAEDAFARARVLGLPEEVAVTFPEALHACVADRTRPWGCCVGSCDHECCEKGLGSPIVTLAWSDGDERLTYHYAHEIGVAWLERRTARGRVRYACLTDAKGTLRAGR